MERITDISQLDLDKQYTYADYLTWWFEDRVELIKGYIKKMSAPLDVHQKVAGNLYYFIRHFLIKHPCQVRIAPYDVRLTRSMNDKEIITVVQPDICVICNPEIIDKRGCNGPPDMIIEVLSPSNSKRDVREKFDVYEEAGVKEYWIVDAESKIISVFLLENNIYKLDKMYAEEGEIRVKTLDGLTLNLEEIFN
ncbi:MAG: Uma2 family endonuclease [Cytophagales bacterium]|nr:MAG: Uma2 family endonuclease [Cytophagales bacterium]